MIDLDTLADDLKMVLRWQLANPGRADGPEVPWAGARIWGLFLRLHEGRAGGGFGPAPITYEAMEAFSAITGESLRPWEIDIIRALDREWSRSVTTKSRSELLTPPTASRPMSPELFDAVFSSLR